MKIKNTVVLLAATSAIATTSAFAQSSVTMYGVIDTMIRSTNHEVDDRGSHGGQTLLESGLFQGSRLGFKGVEDFGNGTAAVFQLEMGFEPDTGASGQQGQLFGRQAFVGLKDKTLGEIDIGRQYGVAFDVLANYDPLNTGNASENSWQLVLTGLRFDNTVKYTNTWGPVTAEVQYSFGEQAGRLAPGSTAGLGLMYDNGPFSLGFFDQQSKDIDSNKMNVVGIGGTYNWEPAKFFLNYFQAKRDAGFNPAASNSGLPLANTTLMGNANNTLQRKDKVLTAGVVYQATPSMAYTLGYMVDRVSNETSAGNSGRLSTVYAVADYNLSKRTDVYFNIDYTRVSGGEIDNGDNTNTVLQFFGAELGGRRDRTGVAVGMRHRF